MKKFRPENFNIVGHSKLIFIISLALIAVFVASVFVFGFNLDVDFTGGATLTVDLGRATTAKDADEITALFKDTVKFAPSSVQRTGESEIVIKSAELNSKNREALQKAITEKYNLSADADTTPISFDNIGSSLSNDVKRSVIVSTVITIALMLIYITFRFEFKSGLAAVVCLALNVVIMLLFYSLFNISVNSNLIACILTILGYSINNTIVIFDRVREQVKADPEGNFAANVNLAIGKSFFRTLNSTITTLLTIVAIFIIGTPSVRNFTLPLIIGIIAGFFTSVFLAGPFWNLIRSNKDGKKVKKVKKLRV